MDAIADKAFTTEAGNKFLSVWQSIEDKLSIKSMLESLVVAMNAHLALNNSNQIAIIASHTDGAKFLYPYNNQKESTSRPKTRSDELQAEDQQGIESRSISPEASQTDNNTKHYINSSMYRQFKVVDEKLLENLYNLYNEPIPTTPPKNHLSSSLSLGLTYINKIQSNDSLMKAKILIVNISQDEHLKYIPIMNCIFAAQKMKVSIDVCQLGLNATFLQQASDATNGVYLHIENMDGLIQYFTTALFIDPSIKNILTKPNKGDIDFRASCFLTGKIVDIGFVCSVCLCILSLIPEDNKCPACDSEFDNHVIMKLKRKPAVIGKKKKKRKLDNGNSTNGTPTPAPTQASTSTPASAPAPTNGK
ncbi:RNA polymerase II transcription factor B subunit 4 [Wickerhamomyces ciferrii]|uniref:General transcription and DNA repair factor IIH subunit TFB4 n=1 Tax=Wickerhamomyces ciferrii (strain ATCC 14091 / BCRC 22168 / CBS 111 / JCM 3599 / NBRC 0793 / NRRL Y-1031 F-60-10) TaxID=1206466 RepID=K0KWW9_WICCF|nr:RNA polymerase II transcription factor B subunit 4 [Wickerhamomyces ciferrii]CCH45984.1 RNA polymerase II transcription factor B subunit 4 [Wickerhamomyces ciferrii]